MNVSPKVDHILAGSTPWKPCNISRPSNVTPPISNIDMSIGGFIIGYDCVWLVVSCGMLVRVSEVSSRVRLSSLSIDEVRFFSGDEGALRFLGS